MGQGEGNTATDWNKTNTMSPFTKFLLNYSLTGLRETCVYGNQLGHNTLLPRIMRLSSSQYAH